MAKTFAIWDILIEKRWLTILEELSEGAFFNKLKCLLMYLIKIIINDKSNPLLYFCK